jgi:hypothetical protein
MSAQAVTTRSQRKLLLAGALALLLAIPDTANSFTLNELLDLPIEQLLRLEITSRQPSQLAVLWAAEHRDAT